MRSARTRPFVGCLTLAVCGLVSGSAFCAEQGLKAEVQVIGREGGLPELGETATVTLAYVDSATGRAPDGLRPDAWIRIVAPDRLPCRDAAQSFRVTRALRRDDIPLFGAWLGVTHNDSRVSLIDPKIDFQGTNLVAMQPLEEQPTATAMAEDGSALLASLPGRGEVVRLSLPDLDLSTFARDLGHPGALLVGDNGSVFVGDRSAASVTHLDASGRRIGDIAVGSGPITLTEVPASKLYPASVLAVAAEGAAVWFDRGNRDVIQTFRAGTIAAGSAVASWPGGFAFARAGGKSLAIAYRDAPADLWDIDVDAGVEGVVADPRGKYMLVWSNTGRSAELIEIAYGRAVQTFQMSSPISDVVFSGESAFVGYRDQPTLSLVDLGARRSGQEALVRPVQLDTGRTDTPAAPVVRIRAIGQDNTALAWIEGGNTAFVLQGGALHATPIVGTIAIKGAPAESLVVLERGLREIGTGTFQASVRLPSRGPLELVATTGVSGTTTCKPIQLAAADTIAAPKIPRLVLLSEAVLKPSLPQTLRIRLDDAKSAHDGAPTMRLLAMSLRGGWSTEFFAERQGDGTYRAVVTFPTAGDYPVVLPQPIEGREVTPIVVEVR